MKNKQLIPLSIAGTALAAFGGCSCMLASNTVHGKRQTADEAMRWQSAHYDTGFYDRLEKADYTIKSYDGYELHVQLCKNPDPPSSGSRYVIISHGYTDNHIGMLKYMPMYLEAGFHCILYDLRGHGENAPFVCSYGIREARDLHVLVEDTFARYGSSVTLGLHGESLGAATTVTSLQYHQNIAFAVADCSFSEITNVLKIAFSKWHLPGLFVRSASVCSRLMYGYSFTEIRPIDALRDNQVPLLLIHGENDRFIVPQNSMDLMDANPGYSELLLVPGAKHANSVLTDPDLYREKLLSFLTDVLKEPE